MSVIVEYKRTLAGVVFMALIIFLWYSQLFQRQKDELARLEREIEDVELLVSNWVSETRNLSDYHNEYANLEKEQHQILSEIPEARQVHELAQQLIEIGKSHDCRVTYVGIPFSEFFSGDEKGGSSRQGDVMILPLKLIVEGSFVSIGHYMETLSGLPLFNAFGELEMDRMSPDGDELESNFSLYVYLKFKGNKGKGVS